MIRGWLDCIIYCNKLFSHDKIIGRDLLAMGILLCECFSRENVFNETEEILYRTKNYMDEKKINCMKGEINGD